MATQTIGDRLRGLFVARECGCGNNGNGNGNGATVATKRRELYPVVVVNTQTLPAGFRVRGAAFGRVVPEGRG